MKIVSIIQGVGTQLRSLAMVFSHAWRPRETLNYPEQAVYAAPRYRGRIVLTRDPDGEERCVACKRVATTKGCKRLSIGSICAACKQAREQRRAGKGAA